MGPKAFVKSTASNGLLIALPIILIVFILAELLQIVFFIATPIAEMLPVETLGGMDVAVVIGLLIIVGLLVLIGALDQTAAGNRAGAWIEDRILKYVPGYMMVKTLTTSFVDTKSEDLAPVMVSTAPGVEDLGFLVKEFPNGSATVFFPLAPTPTIGTLRLVQSDRLRRLEASSAAAMNCVMTWGLESDHVMSETSQGPS